MRQLLRLCFTLLVPLTWVNTLYGQQSEKYLYKLNQVYSTIANYYLDTIDSEEITDKAITEMISALDPHSLYIPADEVAKMNEELAGNFDGIGVEFAMVKDTITVQSVISGGPSERVGIMAGDKIVAIDGKNVAGIGIKNTDVQKSLRGPKGTKVAVDVVRKGESGHLTFVITRDKIPLNSVDAAYLTQDNILYIKLGRFAATSYREIMNSLPANGSLPRAIVLDLRGNGGGYLIAALQIANEFLNRGEMILYTEGRNSPTTREYANGRGILRGVKVAVLIDENSASASEIVSGALQDWDRGIIIGRRSFGKGLVQRQFDLLDGSQLRLTVARYHTPSGRVIQSPYTEGHAEEYYKAFYNRFLEGEASSRDSISFPDSLKYSTLRLKRTVYGGGGIMPDIFTPIDTSFYSPFYKTVLRNSSLTGFVNEYLDAERGRLTAQYATADDFIENFNVTEPLWSEFISYAAARGANYVEATDNISRDKLSEFIKGLIIRTLYGMNSYFYFINRTDGEINKALQVLRSGELFALSDTQS